MRIGGMQVGGADNLTEQRQRRIGEIEFLEDGIEGHIFAVMPRLAAVNVKRRRTQFPRPACNLVGGRENKFRLRVNERLDEPRADDAVNLHLATGDSFHARIRLLIHFALFCQSSACLRLWASESTLPRPQ